MDTVIITGAGGEPALSIARRLCNIGIRVYALAGTIPETAHNEDEFVPVYCDPTSPDAVISAVRSILEKEKHIIGVILAGQYLSENPLEAVSPEEIRLALNARVIAPLCAARLALPALISARGHVVVVSPGSGNAEGKVLNNVADAAAKAFADSLFSELRDTGVKTCHILLQNNEGAPDPAALFTTSPQSRVHADIVADAVETVFRLRENNALTQMILRPQATRETPRIPVSAEPKIRALQVVQLPPKKNFPPEEEPIPTPAYRRPDYAPAKKERVHEADDDGFSDDYVDPELRYLVKNPVSAPQKNKANRETTAESVAADEKPEQTPQPPREGKNRRRNRNRNKNKRRNADGNACISPLQSSEKSLPEAKRAPENKPAPAESAESPEKPAPKPPQSEAAKTASDVPARKDEPKTDGNAEMPEKTKAREKSSKKPRKIRVPAENADKPKPKKTPRPPKHLRKPEDSAPAAPTPEA